MKLLGKLASCCVVGLMMISPLLAQQTEFEDNKRAVLWIDKSAPVIDGDFSEWQGLAGTSVRTPVYGGAYDAADAAGFFVIRTDNRKLYVYVRVSDDRPNENDLPAPGAWRNDSVELYIGASLAPRSKYLKDDSQIRIVPRDKNDPKAFGISVNDNELPGGMDASIVYRADGYEIEAAIPLNFLMIKKFEAGQAIKAEFQVNDADKTERDRLIHWSSPRDDTYYNPGSWGEAVVQALPAKN